MSFSIVFQSYLMKGCVQWYLVYDQGFPSGFLIKGPRDFQCEVNGSLIIIQGLVVLKRLKLLPKY